MLNVLADNNGYIPVSDRPLSKVGVFPYMGSSIGAEDPNKIYMVYRPAEQLSRPETINSFKLVPLIDEHEMLGKDATAAEKKGIQGTTGEDIYFKDGVLYGNMKVFSESMKNLIEGGKKELSLGYKCKYIFEDGVFEGQKYDAIQTDLLGNHIALVSEGRMGKEVSVVDEALKTVVTMDRQDIINIEKVEDMTKEEIQELLKDGVKSAMDEALKPIEDKVNALDEAMKKDESKDEEPKKGEDKEEEKAEDECAEDEKSMDELKKENDSLKKKVEDMEEKMKKDSKGQDEAIKKSVLQEVAQKTRLADKLSSHIGSFDHLEMDLKEVVSYGLDKLELKADEGQELATLNGYLAGAGKVVESKGTDSKDEVKKPTSFNIF